MDATTQIDRKIKSTKIGNNTYKLRMLPAIPALVALKRLSKILAPIGGAFMDAQTSNALDGLKFSTIGTIISENVDDIDIEWLVNLLLAGKLFINDQPIKDIDDHFTNDLGTLIDLIGFALKENFEKAFLESTMGAKVATIVKEMLMITSQSEVQEENPESKEQSSETPT